LEQVRALFRRGTAEDDVIQVDKHQDSLNTILSITLCNVFPVLHRPKGRPVNLKSLNSLMMAVFGTSASLIGICWQPLRRSTLLKYLHTAFHDV
jgi:hypothetical protein